MEWKISYPERGLGKLTEIHEYYCKKCNLKVKETKTNRFLPKCPVCKSSLVLYRNDKTKSRWINFWVEEKGDFAEESRKDVKFALFLSGLMLLGLISHSAKDLSLSGILLFNGLFVLFSFLIRKYMKIKFINKRPRLFAAILLLALIILIGQIMFRL